MRQLSQRNAINKNGGTELKKRMKEQTSEIMDIDDLLDDEGWDILNGLTEEELEQLNSDFDPENTLLPVMERADHMKPINAAPMFTKEDLLGNLEKMVAKSKPVIKNENLRKKEEERRRQKELALDEKYLKKPAKIKEEMPKHIKLTKEEEELLNEATEEELIEAADHALEQGDHELREKILFVLEQRKIEEDRAYSLIDSKLFPSIPQQLPPEIPPQIPLNLPPDIPSQLIPLPIQTYGEPSPNCSIEDEENESLFKPMNHKKNLILDNNNNNVLTQKRFSHLVDYNDDSSSCFENEGQGHTNKQRPNKSKPRKFSKENVSIKNTCIERVKLYNEEKFQRREGERKRKSKRRKSSVKMKIEHLKILKERSVKIEEESSLTESDVTMQENSTSCDTDSAILESSPSIVEENKSVLDNETPIKVNCNVLVNATSDIKNEMNEKKTDNEVVIEVNIDIDLKDHLISQLKTNKSIELETDISETLSESCIDEKSFSLNEKQNNLNYIDPSDENVAKMIKKIKEKKEARKRANSILKSPLQKEVSDNVVSKTAIADNTESNTISKIKQLQQKSSRRNSKSKITSEKPQVKGKLNIVMPNLDSNNSAGSANEKPKKQPSKLEFKGKNPFAKFIKKEETTDKIEDSIPPVSIPRDIIPTLSTPNVNLIKTNLCNEEIIQPNIISLQEKHNEINFDSKKRHDDDNDSGIDRSHSVFSMCTPTDLDSRLDSRLEIESASENPIEMTATLKSDDDTDKSRNNTIENLDEISNIAVNDTAISLSEIDYNRETAVKSSTTEKTLANTIDNVDKPSDEVFDKKNHCTEKMFKPTFPISEETEKSLDSIIKIQNKTSNETVSNKKSTHNENRQPQPISSKVKTNRGRNLNNSKLEQSQKNSSDTNDPHLHHLNNESSSKSNNLNRVVKSKEKLKRINSNEKVDAMVTGKEDLKQEPQIDQKLKRMKARQSLKSKSKNSQSDERSDTANIDGDVAQNKTYTDKNVTATKKEAKISYTEVSTEATKLSSIDSIKVPDESSSSSNNSYKEQVKETFEANPYQLANERTSDQKRGISQKARIRKNSDPFRILNKVRHFNTLYNNKSSKDNGNNILLHNVRPVECAEIKSDCIDETNNSSNKHTIISIDKKINDNKLVEKINANTTNQESIKQEKVESTDNNKSLADIIREKKKNLKNQKKSRKYSVENKLQSIRDSNKRNKFEEEKQKSTKADANVKDRNLDTNLISVQETLETTKEDNSSVSAIELPTNETKASKVKEIGKTNTQVIKHKPSVEALSLTTSKEDIKQVENRQSEKSIKLNNSAQKNDSKNNKATITSKTLSHEVKKTNQKLKEVDKTIKSQELITSVKHDNKDFKPRSKTASPLTVRKEKTALEDKKSDITESSSNVILPENINNNDKKVLKIKTSPNENNKKNKAVDNQQSEKTKTDKAKDDGKKIPSLTKKLGSELNEQDKKSKKSSSFGEVKLKSTSKSKNMGVVDSSKSHDDKEIKKKDNLDIMYTKKTIDKNVFPDVSKASDTVDHTPSKTDLNDSLQDANNNDVSNGVVNANVNKETEADTTNTNELDYFARRKKERQERLAAEELETKNPFVVQEHELPTLSISRFYTPGEEDDDEEEIDPNIPLTADLDSNYFAERKKRRENRVIYSGSPEPISFEENLDSIENKKPVDNYISSHSLGSFLSRTENHTDQTVPLSVVEQKEKPPNRILERLKKKTEIEKDQKENIEIPSQEKYDAKNKTEASKQENKIEKTAYDTHRVEQPEKKIKKKEILEEKEELSEEQKHIINLKIEKEREVQRLLAEIAKMNASLENTDLPDTSTQSKQTHTTHKNDLKTESNTITHQQKVTHISNNTNTRNNNNDNKKTNNKIISPILDKRKTLTTNNSDRKARLDIQRDNEKHKTTSPFGERKLKPPSSQASSTSTSPLLERKLKSVNTSSVNKGGIHNNDNNTKEAGLKALEDIRSKLRKVPKIERQESEEDSDDVTVEEDVSEKRRKMIEEANGTSVKPARKSALELLLEKDAAGLDAKRSEKEKENEAKVDVRGVTAALLQNALLKMNGILTNDQINSVFAGETPKGKSITSKTNVKATAPKQRPIQKQDEETELDVVALMKCLKEDTDDLFYICINNQPKLEKNILKEVFKAIESSQKVKHVSLAMVGIVDADAKVLAKALRYNQQVETLNLESNVIGMSGIDALMKVVGNHPTLREVKVSNQKQPFGGNGEECMATAIDKNENILKFGYSFTNPGPRNKADRAIIRHNENLRQRRRQGEDVYDLKAACKIRDPWPQPWIKVKGRRLLGGLISNKASEMGRKIDVESDVGRESRGPKLKDQEAKPFDINSLLQNRKDKLKGSKIADIEEIQEEKRKKRFLEMQEEARKAKEGDEKPAVDSGTTEITPPAEEEEVKQKKHSDVKIAELDDDETPTRRRKRTEEEDDVDALDFSEFEKKPDPVKIASLDDDDSKLRRRRRKGDDDEEDGLDLSEFEKAKEEEKEEAKKVEEIKVEEKPKEIIKPVKIASLDTPDDGIRRRRKITGQEDEEDSGVDFNKIEEEARKAKEEAEKEKIKEKIKKASLSSDDDKPIRRRRKKFDDVEDDGGIDFGSFEKPKEKKEEVVEDEAPEEKPEVKVEEPKTEPKVERTKKLSREGGKQIVANFGEEEVIPRRRMKERMFSTDQGPEEELATEQPLEEEKPRKVSLTEQAKPIAKLSPTAETIGRRRRPKRDDESDEEIDPFSNVAAKVAKLPSPEVVPKRKAQHGELDEDDDDFDVARIAAERQAEEDRKKKEAAEKEAEEKKKKEVEEKARLSDLESRKKKLSLEGGIKVAPLAPTDDQPVRRRRRRYDDEESGDDFWGSQTTKKEPEKEEEKPEEVKEPEPKEEPVKEPETVVEETKNVEESKKEEEAQERKKKLSREGGAKIASLPSFDDPLPRRRRKTREPEPEEDDNPLFGKKEETPKQEEPIKEEQTEGKEREKKKSIIGGAKIVADLPPPEQVAAVRRKKKVSFEDERKELENPIDLIAKSEKNKIINASKKIKGLEPVDTGIAPIRRRNRYKEDDEEEKYDPFATTSTDNSDENKDKWYTDEETKQGDRRFDEKKSDSNSVDIFGGGNDEEDEKPKKLSLRERMARRGR